MAGNGQRKNHDEDEDWVPESSARGSSRKAKRVKTDQVGLAPGTAEGIEVKTKFPVARIKRIMQADEDVGKVAQVTPVAVCEYPLCYNPLLRAVLTTVSCSQSPRTLHDLPCHQSRFGG